MSRLFDGLKMTISQQRKKELHYQALSIVWRLLDAGATDKKTIRKLNRA